MEWNKDFTKKQANIKECRNLQRFCGSHKTQKYIQLIADRLALFWN